MSGYPKVVSFDSEKQTYLEIEYGTQRTLNQNISSKNEPSSVLRTAQNSVISRCFFAEDGKEMYIYQEL